jgi:hypothetical protein
MSSRRCLATLINVDFWYNLNKHTNSIQIGLNNSCIKRIGEIERIQFNNNFLNTYTSENHIIGYITTYKNIFEVDLHLPLPGYITSFNQHEINIKDDTWLIELLDDDYYLNSELYKFEYGI